MQASLKSQPFIGENIVTVQLPSYVFSDASRALQAEIFKWMDDHNIHTDDYASTFSVGEPKTVLYERRTYWHFQFKDAGHAMLFKLTFG